MTRKVYVNLLKEYLESENFFVTTAKDSQDAKNKIQNFRI